VYKFRAKKYVSLNRERLVNKRRQRYLQIKDKVLEWDKNSRRNKKLKRSIDKNYDLHIKKVANTLHMYKYKNDIFYKLKHRLRSRLRQALKRNYKNSSFNEYLGCSINDLREHVEKLFKPGMTWDNHGKWHLDHIIPLSFFDLSSKEEIKKACNFKNIQPL
jgi:hypothetical protein